MYTVIVHKRELVLCCQRAIMLIYIINLNFIVLLYLASSDIFIMLYNGENVYFVNFMTDYSIENIYVHYRFLVYFIFIYLLYYLIDFKPSVSLNIYFTFSSSSIFTYFCYLFDFLFKLNKELYN